MDAAQAIETVREGLRYECDPISEAIGEGCGTCAGCKGYAALSVVGAQLATHDASMAAANREVLRCMDERDGWKRAHDLAAADWRAAEARANHLQDGLRLIRDTAARWIDRGDTLTASWVIEKADAVLARSEAPTANAPAQCGRCGFQMTRNTKPPCPGCGADPSARSETPT